METEASIGKPTPAFGSVATSSVRWKGVILYLVLAFGISWVIWIGLRAVGVPFIVRVSIGMFGPAVAAALVRGPLGHEGFADAGLRLARRGIKGGPLASSRLYLAAYLVIPALIAAGLLLAVLTGVQHWALNDTLNQLGHNIARALAKQGKPLPAGFTPRQLAEQTLIAQVIAAFTFGLLFNMIFTFGEEFGWRGYLLPRLAPLGGAWAAIITGVIWGLWHVPLVALDGFNFPGHPWLGVLMMAVALIPLSIVFAWLRFRSGSIWPSTLAHAALNAQAGFVFLLSPADSLLRPPLGLMGIIPFAAFAIWLIATGRLKAEPQT